MGKKIWLFMHERNFGSQVTVRPSARPPVLPSAPQGNQCEMICFPVSWLQPVYNLMIKEKEKQQQQSRVLKARDQIKKQKKKSNLNMKMLNFSGQYGENERQ